MMKFLKYFCFGCERKCHKIFKKQENSVIIKRALAPPYNSCYNIINKQKAMLFAPILLYSRMGRFR